MTTSSPSGAAPAANTTNDPAADPTTETPAYSGWYVDTEIAISAPDAAAAAVEFLTRIRDGRIRSLTCDVYGDTDDDAYTQVMLDIVNCPACGQLAVTAATGGDKAKPRHLSAGPCGERLSPAEVAG